MNPRESFMHSEYETPLSIFANTERLLKILKSRPAPVGCTVDTKTSKLVHKAPSPPAVSSPTLAYSASSGDAPLRRRSSSESWDDVSAKRTTHATTTTISNLEFKAPRTTSKDDARVESALDDIRDSPRTRELVARARGRILREREGVDLAIERLTESVRRLRHVKDVESRKLSFEISEIQKKFKVEVEGLKADFLKKAENSATRLEKSIRASKSNSKARIESHLSSLLHHIDPETETETSSTRRSCGLNEDPLLACSSDPLLPQNRKRHESIPISAPGNPRKNPEIRDNPEMRGNPGIPSKDRRDGPLEYRESHPHFSFRTHTPRGRFRHTGTSSKIVTPSNPLYRHQPRRPPERSPANLRPEGPHSRRQIPQEGSVGMRREGYVSRREVSEGHLRVSDLRTPVSANGKIEFKAPGRFREHSSPHRRPMRTRKHTPDPMMDQKTRAWKHTVMNRLFSSSEEEENAQEPKDNVWPHNQIIS
ncbi:hypothetical protein AAMO2058_000205100 [Amorphochlora amoebiformis]